MPKISRIPCDNLKLIHCLIEFGNFQLENYTLQYLLFVFWLLKSIETKCSTLTCILLSCFCMIDSNTQLNASCYIKKYVKKKNKKIIPPQLMSISLFTIGKFVVSNCNFVVFIIDFITSQLMLVVSIEITTQTLQIFSIFAKMAIFVRKLKKQKNCNFAV